MNFACKQICCCFFNTYFFNITWFFITLYALRLSGLSPFSGETEQETLSYVTACEVDFDDDCFDDVSEEAKDFILELLARQER